MQLPEDKESAKKMTASIKRALEREPFDIMCDYCVDELRPAFAIIENKLAHQDANFIFDALRSSVNKVRDIYKPREKGKGSRGILIMIFDTNERMIDTLNKGDCMRKYKIHKPSLDKALETGEFWCNRKYYGDLRRTFKFVKYD